MFGFNYKYKINPDKGIITLRPSKGLTAASLAPYAIFAALVGYQYVRELLNDKQFNQNTDNTPEKE
jgi:hypothetical protein